MIVTRLQMQQCEESAFARGISAAALMEEAGCGIADVIRQFFPKPGVLVLYLGKGNNAGDALIAGRELAKDGWKLLARLACPVEQMKELPQQHFSADIQVIETPPTQGCIVMLDGLLGIGAKGVMKPELSALAQEMNDLRRSHHHFTVAMDIPSGIGEDDDAVEADITVCIGHIKDVLLEDGAERNVGRIALVPLKGLENIQGDSRAAVLTPQSIRSWLPHRPNDMHKGHAGRVCILAGSPGFLGAAELACRGALRAGAGLITLLVKEEAYPHLAARMPAEIMVKQVDDYREVLQMHADALAVGPGLGFEHENEILDVLRDSKAPTIIDADALTMLASHPDVLEEMNGLPRLLTPHHGEMNRFLEHFPGWHGMNRRTLVEMFTKSAPKRTLLLKGTRTVIATAGEPTLFNTTGHPGMATGGMGDVLTGVCTTFAAQRVPLHHGAGLGAWLCGRAAEISGRDGLCASDVAAHLGEALRELKSNCW